MIFDSVEFKKYSATLGSDPSLVQGAGGNTSCKDENTLWVKASGTWLANAEKEEIFVPLSLPYLRSLIKQEKTDYSSAVLSSTTLRPSIETSLHALLPHKIVLHVHAIDVIAWSILKKAPEYLSRLLKGLNWAWIPYVQPGISLSNKIKQYFEENEPADILVLGNHGLVIGADSLEVANQLLQKVLSLLTLKPKVLSCTKQANVAIHSDYELCTDQKVNALMYDNFSLKLIQEKWALYPDHVVFLGGVPPLMLLDETEKAFFERMLVPPVLIFLPFHGVFLKKNIKKEQKAMLSCYADVLLRVQEDLSNIVSLNQKDIATLLNWDAEKYRQRRVV